MSFITKCLDLLCRIMSRSVEKYIGAKESVKVGSIAD